MDSCRNKVVCKHAVHAIDGHCELDEVCKHFTPVLIKEEGTFLPAAELTPAGRKKRKYNKRKKSHPWRQDNGKSKDQMFTKKKYDFLTTSDKDIRRAQQILKFRRVAGTLSDNQCAALDVFKSIKTKKLNEQQRQQVLDVLKDSSKVVKD